jgi:hypothetical protein
VTESLERGSTRLVLPVPEVTGQVPDAHVVLLDPFLPVAQVDEGVVEELRDLFAEVVPFVFVLGEATRFPTGAAYLPPQPAAPFRAIVHTLRRAFPEVTAPSAAFDAVIPHLAVPEDDIESVTTTVEAHAREALLLAADGAVLASFRFGTSAA